VRDVLWIVPSRTRRQFTHEQFHCGKPPPAALPNIFTCILQGSLKEALQRSANPSDFRKHELYVREIKD